MPDEVVGLNLNARETREEATNSADDSLPRLFRGKLSPPSHQPFGGRVNHPEERVVRCRRRVELSHVPVRQQSAEADTEADTAAEAAGTGGKGRVIRLLSMDTGDGRVSLRVLGGRYKTITHDLMHTYNTWPSLR